MPTYYCLHYNCGVLKKTILDADNDKVAAKLLPSVNVLTMGRLDTFVSTQFTELFREPTIAQPVQENIQVPDASASELNKPMLHIGCSNGHYKIYLMFVVYYTRRMSQQNKLNVWCANLAETFIDLERTSAWDSVACAIATRYIAQDISYTPRIASLEFEAQQAACVLKADLEIQTHGTCVQIVKKVLNVILKNGNIIGFRMEEE